ncbi:MAG: hypothetical protein CMJ46_16860 [Planctomyces sp.]|nr:hypothetical protein [Planctomyces sp.]
MSARTAPEFETQSSPAARPDRAMTALLVTIWIIGVGLALRPLWKYEMTPGADNARAEHWPVDSGLVLQGDKPTLILFAHPRCPCTRATMEELARLMANCSDRLHAEVHFYLPQDANDEWRMSDLWKAVQQIPGVAIHEDINGEEASRFGAISSGSTFLYSRAGDLVFAGGITSSRGHAGSNKGRQAIEEYVLNGKVIQSNSYVFGCPILTSDQNEEGIAY